MSERNGGFVSRKDRRKEERKDKKMKRNLNNYYRHGKIDSFGEKTNNNKSIIGKKQDFKTNNYKNKKNNINKYNSIKSQQNLDNLKLKEDYDDYDEEIDSDEASLHPDDDSDIDESEDDKYKAYLEKTKKANNKESITKKSDKTMNIDIKGALKEVNDDDNENLEETEEEMNERLFGATYYNQNLAAQGLIGDDVDEELDKELKYLEKKLKIKKKKNYDQIKKNAARDNFDDDLFDFLDKIEKTAKLMRKGKKSKITSIKNKTTEEDLEIEEDEEVDEEIDENDENNWEAVEDNEEDINMDGEDGEDEDNEDIENEDVDVDEWEEVEDEENEEDEDNEDMEIDDNSKSENSNMIQDSEVDAKKKDTKFEVTEELLKTIANLNQAFQKELNSVFNKTSESNIQLLYKDMIIKIENQVNALVKLSKYKVKGKTTINSEFLTKQLSSTYAIITKLIFKAVLDNPFMNIGITSCLCTYLSILHYLIGDNFMKYFLKELFTQFHKLSEITHYDTRVSKLKNFTFIMIFFFLFKNLTLKLAGDMVSYFIDNFDEFYSEVLFILLSHIGIQLRREDPEAVKRIIASVKVKFNNLKQDNKEAITSKFKSVVEMIEEIKNNKFLKFNVAEKYAFQKNLVNQAKIEVQNKSKFDINSKKEHDFYFSSNDQIELVMTEIMEFDFEKNLLNLNNTILKKKELKEKENKDTLEEDSDDFSINSEDLEEQYNIIQIKSNKNNKNASKTSIKDLSTEKFNETCKKLKINTDLKKNIFRCIISANDYNMAYEKLLKLNLNKEQEREIVKILILLCVNENEYNPFYFFVLKLLMKLDNNHVHTYKYTHWDYIRNSEALNKNGIKNLARLTSELLQQMIINLVVFIPLDFTNKTQTSLLSSCLEHFFNNAKYDTVKLCVSKLIKNDDHNNFYRELLGFVSSPDFKNDIESKNQENNVEANFEAERESILNKYKEFIRILKKVL